MFPDTLVTDLTEQGVGTKVKASTAFGDGHDAGAEEAAALGLAEEAGFTPDDVGPERALGGVVGCALPRRI